jgi:hypothetical protein
MQHWAHRPLEWPLTAQGRHPEPASRFPLCTPHPVVQIGDMLYSGPTDASVIAKEQANKRLAIVRSDHTATGLPSAMSRWIF